MNPEIWLVVPRAILCCYQPTLKSIRLNSRITVLKYRPNKMRSARKTKVRIFYWLIRSFLYSHNQIVGKIFRPLSENSRKINWISYQDHFFQSYEKKRKWFFIEFLVNYQKIDGVSISGQGLEFDMKYHISHDCRTYTPFEEKSFDRFKDLHNWSFWQILMSIWPHL